MTQIKLWGKSTSIFANEKTQILEIVVEPGGFCSHHYHQDRDNLFWVFTGQLLVAYGTLLDTVTLLTPVSAPLVIPAMTEHRFWTLTGCYAYEQYRPTGTKFHDPNDIVRLDEGGIHCDTIHHRSSSGREAPFRIPAHLADLEAFSP